MDKTQISIILSENDGSMADILELTKLSYVVIIGAAIYNLASGILEPLAGPYLEELGASSKEIGIILSARWLVVAIFSIPFAVLATKFGHVNVLYVSAIAAVISAFVLVSIDGILGLKYFYYSIGLAGAAASGPAAAILAENTGTKRIAAFSLFSITWMLPPAIGAGISAYWFRNNPSYKPENIQTIFPIVFNIMLLGVGLYIILLFLFRNEDKSDVKEETITVVDQMRLLFAPMVAFAIFILIIVNFLSGAGAGATLPFLAPYLKSLGADAKEVSLLVLVLNLVMSLATQIVAPLSKKFGQLRVFTATQILSVIALLGIVFSNELLIAAIFYILRGAFANMNAPISQSITLDYIDRKVRATGSAITTNIRWIGWVIFSPISGSIIDVYGYETSFVFTGVLYLIATALFLWVTITKPDLETINADVLINPIITQN